MDAYCTHQEYTKKELENLKSKSYVLELGIGNGSSPLMYEFCKNNPKSTVVSFETDSAWFNQMYEKYGDLPNYIFNLISDWNDLSEHLERKSYDLVFVDQSPWEARIQSIDLLKDKTKLFILHDYDYFNKDDSGFSSESCNSIYVNDDSSWLGKTYSGDFILEDYYEILPPTLIMRKK
jgi:hypothetical protein